MNILQMIQNSEVEWKTLGEIAEIGTGSSNRQDEDDNGQYPFYVRSKNVLKSNTFQFDETAIIIPGEGGIGDIFHYTQGKYALHQRAYRISPNKNEIIPKFLYYVMYNDFKEYILKKSVGATAISIRKPMLENFQIPIPPLAVQERIVQILDNFTELTTELTIREKQYAYYREKLLNFDDQAETVEWKMIGEVIKSIKTGLNPRKNFKLNTTDANNFYVTVREIQDGKIIFSEKTDKVNDDALILINNRSTLEVGDVLFSGTGTVGRMAVIDQVPKNWNIKEGVYVLKPKIELISSKYLFHILNKQQIVDNYKRKIVGSPVISLPMSELKKIKIPIPPLAEQARIVAILDKFDALTHSITEGLPREIELRQKQYEYYRNLLLSFPRP